MCIDESELKTFSSKNSKKSKKRRMRSKKRFESEGEKKVENHR